MRFIESVVDVVLRFITSMALPAWGLITLGVGINYGAPWWIATGAAIAVIGAVILIGSPLVRPFLYDA